MTDRGETLASVAAAVGKSPQAVHKWLRGGDIGFDTLIVLADYLQTNWVLLRHGEEAFESVRRDLTEPNPPLDVFHRNFVTDFSRVGAKTRLLLTDLNVGLWESNFVTGEGFWSAVARRLMRASDDVSPNQLVFRDMVYASDLPAVDEPVYRILRGETDTLTQRFRLRSDPTVWLEVIGQCFRDDDGHAIRMIGLMRQFDGEDDAWFS